MKGVTSEKMNEGGEFSLDEVDQWIKRLRAKNRISRRNAATALGEIGNERAVDVLIAALHDEDFYVRGRATSALCKIGGKAVDSLIAALNDDDPDVRSRAACALGTIGNVKAIPHLGKIVDDLGKRYRNSDRTIGDDAREAIKIIKSRDMSNTGRRQRTTTP